MAWTPTGGGDHGGADWTVSTSFYSIAGTHTNVGIFTVTSAGSLYVHQTVSIYCIAADLQGPVYGAGYTIAAAGLGGAAGTCGEYPSVGGEGSVPGFGGGLGGGNAGAGGAHAGYGGSSGGGGYPGAGAAGGQAGGGAYHGSGSSSGYGNNIDSTNYQGSGGGGGGGAGGGGGNVESSESGVEAGETAAYGGEGGFAIRIEALRLINVNAWIFANGDPGYHGSKGGNGAGLGYSYCAGGGGGGGQGAGGGAGGGIYLKAPKVTAGGSNYLYAYGGYGGDGGHGGNGGIYSAPYNYKAGGGDGGTGGGGGGGGRIKILTSRPAASRLGSFSHAENGGPGGAGGSGGIGTPNGYSYPNGGAGGAGTFKTSNTAEQTPDVIYQGKIGVEANGWIRKRMRAAFI